MKKLSKVLSLVLVIAMVFSLCVIGASASYADFTDTDKITEDYKEAVDTMTGVGIIDGMTATTFDAQGNFTRAQAAKIISYMQLGVTAASALKGTGTGYKDVAATAWYAPYVAYCTQQGIIGGYGNGNFGPNDALTGYQFAKMLLCAVGYGVNKEYTGSSWSINVAKDALNKGVFDGVLSASTNAVITREQATQMAFNTLAGIPTVTYSSLYGDYIYAVGNVGTANNVNGITLGQKAFGLKEHMCAAQADYGYNGHVWYKNNTINSVNKVSGWYMTDTIVESNVTSAGMTGAQLYKAYTWDTTGVQIIINGEAEQTINAADYKNVNTKVLQNFNGAQFNFVDSDNDGDVDTIVIVVTYFGEVTGVTKATTTAPQYATIKISNRNIVNNIPADVTVNVEDTALVKGDFVSIIPAGNSQITANAIITPLSMEKLTAKTSAVDSYTAYTVTLGGTVAYNSFVADVPASYSFNGATYDFYMDANGFVIGARLNQGGTLNYAYLAQASSAATNGNLINGTTGLVKVKLVYADGTAEVLNYQVKVATAADTNKVNSADTASTTYLAVGDYYYAVGQINGSTLYYKTTNADGIAVAVPGLAAGGAVSYVKNDDGTVSLSLKHVKTVNSTDYAAYVLPSGSITLKANVASVGITGYYVGAATKLVVVGTDGKATTTTGYANFPAAGVTYTVAATTAIYFETTGNTITSIVVIGAPAAAADTVYGMFTGNYSNGATGTTDTFLVNGTETSYLMATALNPSTDKGGLYQITFSAGKATATKIADIVSNATTGTGLVDQTVTAVDAAYFAVGNNAYYYGANVKAYFVNPTAATMSEDTIAVNDTVTFVYTTDTNGVNTVVAAFITAHA